jgi:parvulin-like peptidyl-prolyl isomerase
LKSFAIYLCVGALALAGCNPSSTPPAASADSPAPVSATQTPAPSPAPGSDSDSRIVAKVAGEPITLGELMKPLIAAHGLTTLLQVVELDLVKQQAAQRGITVTPADIQHERDVTIGRMFKDADDKLQTEIDDAQAAHDDKKVAELKDEMKDQHDMLMGQFLDNQHLAASEFDTVMEINAYLRKIAAPAVDKAITPEVLKHAFNDQYGARMRVRYIQVSTMQQVNDIKKALASGAEFSELARTRSENLPSRELGGELPPFSARDSNYPKAFRDAAVVLKPGEVSDAVEIGNNFFLIKMEEWLPPLAVKFDDVKDSLRQTLYENIMQQEIKSLRDQIGALAIQEMKIVDPTMKQQYDQRQEQHEAQVRDQKRIKEEMDAEHQRLWGQINAATQPATAPATEPATRP